MEFIAKYPPLLAIGNTPMVKIDADLDIGDAEIHVKYEHLNPGGSIKDRPVLRMLGEAILSGELTKEKSIIDATSGNAGIAYAMIGAVLGYKVTLVMPENASEERKKRLIAHGAEIIFTDPCWATTRRCTSDQYSNPNNPQAHYDTTAEEILRQAPNITHFVGGVGTGGTISGVGRRLKEHNPDIKVISIDPPEWPGVEGLKPLSAGHIIPDTFDSSVVDEMLEIDVDASYEMSHKLSAIGLFAGQSSGAYVQGAYEIARRDRSGQIVTIFNDIGERYFSTGMWG
ncbi:Cysteine synthase B [Geodia barretti]|uniref:Cysteine synthase B n=1 Tax=Geodia barretti TaxID=519541 RepID=A0AA35X8G5_GEOBA|nr:Cysteine synthase B [Geodia barretti]